MTVKLIRTFDDDGAVVTAEESFTEEQVIALDVAVADSETDKEVALGVDVSQIAALLITSDQDVTIETNDGSTPDDTLTLKANNALVWSTNCGYSCPLTADITGNIFVTNASGSTANIKIRICYTDATP